MRIVGLTGGIASGKSSVSKLLKSHGIPVVDADLIARNALNGGTSGYRKVVSVFGNDILHANGEINRSKLGHIVFSNPTKRRLLNRLLAPYISLGILWEIFVLWVRGNEVIVLDVPLLFETKMEKWTNPVIVVWVDSGTQLLRLMERDGITEEEAMSRVESQMPLDRKREKADVVIDNTGSLMDLEKQVHDLLGRVTSPLSWSQFLVTRQGVFIALLFPLVSFLVKRVLG